MHRGAQPPGQPHGGQAGWVTSLLKNPDQPVQEANLRGITISSHVSKLERTAFYAVATAVYERALGGPCLVGGMRGISLQEVVRTVHMKLDLARLQNRIVDVLITDLAKFFDVIAQDNLPYSGSPGGPGRGRPPRHPYRGFLLHPALGPLAVPHPDATPGYAPPYRPGGPCGGDGGAPLLAVHGHRKPGPRR